MVSPPGFLPRVEFSRLQDLARPRGHNCEGPSVDQDPGGVTWQAKARARGVLFLVLFSFTCSLTVKYEMHFDPLHWLPSSSYPFWESRGTRFGIDFADCSRFLSRWAATIGLRSTRLCLSDESNLIRLSAVLISCSSIGHLLGGLAS